MHSIPEVFHFHSPLHLYSITLNYIRMHSELLFSSMDGSDTKELIQKWISDFVGYLMTNHSLSKAAVVTGMEAYIALNKSRNKDVEVEECFGNLAWTTSCLSDSKNLSSSVLFFVLDPSMNLSEDSAEKIGLRCIICNMVICMDAMRDGNGYWYKY